MECWRAKWKHTGYWSYIAVHADSFVGVEFTLSRVWGSICYGNVWTTRGYCYPVRTPVSPPTNLQIT